MSLETISLDRSYPGERFDSWLRKKFPALSRGAIQRLIDEGHITVNGAKTKPTHNLRVGEIIRVEIPEAKPAEAQPEDIPLNILYEDAALLVLNKPPGLVVHPAAGNQEHTLVNALLHHCEGELSGIGGVARPGIVHRLDKDTSGCLVVAKNDESHVALSAQFAGRSVHKVYHAILCGEVLREQGEIHAAIARHVTQRKRMTVDDKRGRQAHTSYEVLERLNQATLVAATIHTGRTHQIRVHFQHLGFPLVGDDTYGQKQNRRLTELTRYTAPRQMLHAHELGFTHPRTGKKLKFKAPLPDDFMEAIKVLRVRS